MSQNPIKDKLELLFDAVASELLTRVKSGEAKPQDLAVAVKFLKDNGIECLPTANKSLEEITKLLGSEAYGGPDQIVQ